MDFLKHNWGFLLLSIAGIIVAIVCLILCLGSKTKLQQTTEEVKKVQSYLDGVAKKKIRLNQENITIAEKNSAEASKGLKLIKDELGKKFQLKFSFPNEPTTAVRELKDEISALQAFLLERDIQFAQNCENFTMDAYVASGIILNKDDLKPIFKQLAIIKEVVKIAAAAKVISIDDLARPMGLIVQEEGVYSFVPVEITITASPDNAQKFVNLMSQSSKILFFLRNIEIQAADATTELGADLKPANVGDRGGEVGGRNGRGGMAAMDRGDMGGMDRGAPLGGAGRGGRGRRRQNQDMMPGGEMGMGNQDGNVVEEKIKRQDLLAFEGKTTTWILRYDYIEFPAPEAEENADGEGNNTGSAE